MIEAAVDDRSHRLTGRDWLILVGIALSGIALRFAAYRIGLQGGSFDDYLAALCRWDCGFYRSVALGYHDLSQVQRGGSANWAFFPLYPLLVGTLQAVTGLGWNMAGFVVSNTLGLLAAAAARPLIRGSERAYWLFVIGLLLGPFSLLFSLPYSESLFILLTILALRALQRSDYLVAGLWGALMSATRVTGLLIGVAILVQAIQDSLRTGIAPAALPARLLGDRRLLLAGLLVPLGLIAFMLHLKFAIGDGLAFSRVQIAWGRNIGNPLTNWLDVMTSSWPFTGHFGLFSTHAWFAGFGFVLAAVLAATGRWAAAAFCVAALLLSLSAGLTSLTRFFAGLAPLCFPLAEWIGRSRWATWITAPLAVALGVGVTMGWLLNWNLMV